MKALMLVCDGMADRPVKELGGRTPLEVAKTPNMDRLAKNGICGIVDPIAPGVRPGSDTSHLVILGYDPYEVYTGRGPFEAAGVGLELREGDIAFRCNFATVDESLIVEDRRAGRISEGTDKLAKAINKIRIPSIELIFKESVAHRGVLVLRGEGLSHRISDSDPHAVGVKVRKFEALDNSPEASYTAEILNHFSEEVYKVLKSHRVNLEREEKGKLPANMLLVRGCGRVPRLKTFEEKYRISGACMATTGIIKGIAKFLGMRILEAEKDYVKRARMALQALDDVDFLLINVKEPDEAAHDHDFRKKISIIEDIDKMVGEFLEFSAKNYMLLLSDHTTPTSVGDHTGDAVPLVICGPEVRTDEVQEFTERTVVRGGLSRIMGRDLMPILLDLMNKSEKFGA